MEEALEAALEAVGATGTDGPALLAGVPPRDTDLVGGACEGLAFFSGAAEGGTGVALLLGAGSASEIT
jgi:hypothetical protein